MIFEFPIRRGICVSVKELCDACSQQAVNGHLALKLLCVLVMIRMKRWKGNPEEGENDCRNVQGHIHSSL